MMSHLHSVSLLSVGLLHLRPEHLQSGVETADVTDNTRPKETLVQLVAHVIEETHRFFNCNRKRQGVSTVLLGTSLSYPALPGMIQNRY